MSGEEEVRRAAAADELQAHAFCEFFERERRELWAKHSKLVKVGGTRREILRLETDIRHFDRMVAALVRRYPQLDASR